MGVIETKNLTKYYGDSLGIKDVNLNVEEGEIFGFIGPNGAGKSTTIRLLMSLIYPTSGEAKLFGKDAIEDGPEVRKRIGYLPSEIFYYDKMKVVDLLSYSASFYSKDSTKRIKELAIAIQSANYGFSILSEEERELTANFLMSKPVARSTIYFSKFFAALLSLFLTAIAVGISSFMALELFNNGESYEISNVLKLILTIPIFQLLFLSVGMFVSLLFKKFRSVLSLSMGLAIGLYVVNSVSGIVDSDILGYITPYYYFEPGLILIDGKYDLKLFLIAIGIIILALTSSYLLYKKRDIHSL